MTNDQWQEFDAERSALERGHSFSWTATPGTGNRCHWALGIGHPLDIGHWSFTHLQLSRVFVFQPVFHGEAQERQAIGGGRSSAAEDSPHVFVDVREGQSHQQIVPQYLPDAKAGE